MSDHASRERGGSRAPLDADAQAQEIMVDWKEALIERLDEMGDLVKQFGLSARILIESDPEKYKDLLLGDCQTLEDTVEALKAKLKG